MKYNVDFASGALTPLGRWLVESKHKSIVKVLGNHVNLKGSEAMEIGPGRGSFAMRLKEEGCHMELIEPSSVLRDILRDHGFDYVNDYFIPPIKAADDSKDLIVLMNVFEHMDDPQMAREVMGEFYRVLKKDGVLVMNTPDALFWGLKFWDGDYTHNYVTTRNRLEQMFSDYGFKILVMRHYSGPLHGFWTPLLSILMQFQIWIDLIPVKSIRTKINKLRNTFLSDVFFIVQKI